MKNESNSENEVVRILETPVVVVERRDEILLCESDTGKGWIFYGVDQDGLADGGFCYPSLRCAGYGFRHQDKIAWTFPPLDFGWECNESERPYDMDTLLLLDELFNGGAIVLDDENQTHKNMRALLENSTEDEQHSLIQHIAPVIGQHEVPELVS